MEYRGFGAFFDEDQVITADVWELFSYCRKRLPKDFDVAVVKSQPQFEWPSVMVFNCERLQNLTPEYIDSEVHPMFDFGWAQNVAELPDEWNHFVGANTPKKAKLYHWSRGIPYWPECRGNQEDEEWFKAFDAMKHSGKWVEFHRNTKHFKPVMQKFLADNYGLKVE